MSVKLDVSKVTHKDEEIVGGNTNVSKKCIVVHYFGNRDDIARIDAVSTAEKVAMIAIGVFTLGIGALIHAYARDIKFLKVVVDIKDGKEINNWSLVRGKLCNPDKNDLLIGIDEEILTSSGPTGVKKTDNRGYIELSLIDKTKYTKKVERW